MSDPIAEEQLDDLDAERARLSALLGVAPDCSPDELHDAYRTLVRTHHPDAGGDPDFMVTINAAYQRLSDLPQAARLDDFLGEPEEGWVWADDQPMEVVAPSVAKARTVLSLVLLPAVAIALLVAAVWFIAVVG